MDSQTFKKFFENSSTYHSFTDILNLAKETSDYIYNNDIIKSKLFNSFKETDKGFQLIFDRVDKDDIFIDASKKTIKDKEGIDINLDKAYSDIEDLYRDIKLEFYVNIKQMNEGLKTFEKFAGNKIKTFSEMSLINEKFTEEFDMKLSDDYKSLKKGILELIDQTLKGDVTKIQKFINDYIEEDSEEVLDGFIEDADIFDTYLKYQSDIDELLDEELNYFNDAPTEIGLYNYVVRGTFEAVVYCMKLIKEELFGKEENE